MTPASQVLLRQQQLFAGNILLAGAPGDELLDQLPAAHAWCWLADTATVLQQRYGQRVSSGTLAPAGTYDAGVLFLPKARELSACLLQQLASMLHGKPLYLVGEKRAGIEGASKLLAGFGRHHKIDSARHCQLWQCQVEQQISARPLTDWQHSWQYQDLEIVSLPGVFSHGRLDKGTRLLLEHLHGLPDGHWLDFGCGAGILGAQLLQQHPHARVSLLDVDAFAVHSARLTLAANQLAGQVIFGRGIIDAPRQLAAIISNPPFHQGVKTSYQATEQLIQQAREHLQPGGELRIVANSFLKYPPLIEEHLGPCRVLAERDGFRVYSAKRTK